MLLNNCRVCKSNTLCYFQKTYKNQSKINQNRSGQVNAYTFVEDSKKFILLQRASRSLLRQVYVGLLNHQKTYKNQCKINQNRPGQVNACTFVEDSKKFILLERASRSLLRQVYGNSKT